MINEAVLEVRLADLLEQIERRGFVVLKRLFSTDQLQTILEELAPILSEAPPDSALRGAHGGLYGARNILSLWPKIVNVWQVPPLTEALATVLGLDFGLVRVLYFDKPPGASWTLPWHQDLTIAVRNNSLPTAQFRKPTTKAGVAHIEAPREVLEKMLTVRLHLDEVTSENGPLRVIPGSHRNGKSPQFDESDSERILVDRGDVLLIRPLVVHCSGRSHPGTEKHRRVLHLEFSATPTLPESFEWDHFIK